MTCSTACKWIGCVGSWAHAPLTGDSLKASGLRSFTRTHLLFALFEILRGFFPGIHALCSRLVGAAQVFSELMACSSAHKCMKKAAATIQHAAVQRCQIDAARPQRNDDGSTSSPINSTVQAFSRAWAARRAAYEEAARR